MFAIADNRLAELAEWDHEILCLEFPELIELGNDVEETGFPVLEVDDNVARSVRLALDQVKVASLDELGHECALHKRAVGFFGDTPLIVGELLDPEPVGVAVERPVFRDDP